MAKRIEELILDDMTGEVGASPRQFGLDGTAYEIDLGDKNSRALSEALAPFVAAARRLGKNGSSPNRRLGQRVSLPSAASTEVTTAEDRKAIRAWWKANQRNLSLPAYSDRGRIPESVVQAYRAPQNAPAAPATPDVPASAVEAPSAPRRGRQPIPVPPADELLAAYDREGSVRGVATKYGVSQATAQRWLNNAQLARV